jgi:F-type H+-transporting ATPase subunit beta
MSDRNQDHGTVLSIRGSVVDVEFRHNLPAINNLLRAGDRAQVLIEVWAQLDAHRIRGIAMTPPQGLARGARVEDTGGPLKVPVGKSIRSRMFNVFGQPIDRAGDLADVELRSIHRSPPALAERITRSEIFETGIKAIDVLRGWQDRSADRDDPQHDRASRGCQRVLRYRGALP